ARDLFSHRIHPNRLRVRNALRSLPPAKDSLPQNVPEDAHVSFVHADEDQPEATISPHLREPADQRRRRLLLPVRLTWAVHAIENYDRANLQAAAVPVQHPWKRSSSRLHVLPDAHLLSPMQ